MPRPPWLLSTSTSLVSSIVTSNRTTYFWIRQDISNCQISVCAQVSKSHTEQTFTRTWVTQPLNCPTFLVPEDQWIPNEEQNLGRKIEDNWLIVQLVHQITLLQKCFKTQGKHFSWPKQFHKKLRIIRNWEKIRQIDKVTRLLDIDQNNFTKNHEYVIRTWEKFVKSIK